MEQNANPQLVAKLSKAITNLPQQQREIFLAVRQDGATYAELAVRFDTTADEIKRQFAATLVALVQAADGE